MPPESLRVRVERLEQRVEILERLPDRVSALETQIVLLRDEMRSEFSATRAMSRQGDDTVVKTLREEIRAGDDETRRYMRVLHEDLVQRIATFAEGR
jgi:hypothetical protein